MAIPAQGFMRIYPANVSIISGSFSVSGNGVGSASALATVEQLQTYYDTRTDTPANAPRLRFVNEIPALGGTFVPAAASYELEFSSDTTRILFDPSGVAEEIDFLSADFPMGCVLTQLRIHWNGAYTVGPSRDRQLTDLSLKYFGATEKQVVPTPGTTFSGDVESGVFDIIPFNQVWSPIQIFKPFGWSTVMSSVTSALTSQPQLRNDLIYLECVYSTTSFSVSLDTPNAGPGDVVEISGSGLKGLFDDIVIYWDTQEGQEDDPEIPGFTGGISVPVGLIRTWTNTNLRFILPVYHGIPYAGRRIMVTLRQISGTSFVGSFPIANLNILLADGSGIYQLESGKRNDTYYDRSVSPVSTTDLAIPNPRLKTGFF